MKTHLFEDRGDPRLQTDGHTYTSKLLIRFSQLLCESVENILNTCIKTLQLFDSADTFLRNLPFLS